MFSSSCCVLGFCLTLLGGTKLLCGTTPPWKGKGPRGWIGKCCQPDSHHSTLSQPLARPSALSVCREDCSDLVLDSPVFRGGADIPDTPPGPSVENPLENLFPAVVSVASRSGGARGGQAAAAASAPPGASDSAGRGCALSARAPPGLALQTSGATRWHPVPRRRVCAGAGLGLLPSLGGSVAPAGQYSGSFLELPVQQSEKPPGSPRLWEATPQRSSEAMGVLCHPHSWPFGHHWENARNTQAPTESGNRLPYSLPQLFILSSLRVGEFGARPEP